MYGFIKDLSNIEHDWGEIDSTYSLKFWGNSQKWVKIFDSFKMYGGTLGPVTIQCWVALMREGVQRRPSVTCICSKSKEETETSSSCFSADIGKMFILSFND